MTTENTELAELQRRLHDAHESSSLLRDTITRLEAENVMLAKHAAEAIARMHGAVPTKRTNN